MKKESVLIALAIGFLVFILNWDEKSGEHPNNSIKMAAIALGVYYGLKRYIKNFADEDKDFKITYGRLFKEGLYMCFIASVFSCLLYFTVPNNSQVLISMTEKTIRSLDVLISVVIIGIFSVAISSGILIKRQS